MRMPPGLLALWHDVRRFPWRGTASTLGERFREDRLGLTASSLTFTTTIALVPLFTVGLAVFSAFPMFGQLQFVLQRWLFESLVPDAIARQVLVALTQFAQQASRLGGVGVAVVLVTALALILTIDRTLNGIWRVRQPRRLAQRVLVYWAAMTLGPLLLASSIALTSYAVAASRDLVGGALGGVNLLLDIAQLAIIAAGAAGMYYYVPNTRVRWAHAWTGGLFVAIGLESAKKLLVLYLGNVPTYSVVYGTFATVPILLVWIYLAWVIVLLGAVITAYLPSLLAGIVRRDTGAGTHFQLALEALRLLQGARASRARGIGIDQLARTLRISALGIETALEALVELDWVARLDDDDSHDEPRYVLLVDPDQTTLEPLVDKLLLRHNDSTDDWWRATRMAGVRLADVL